MTIGQVPTQSLPVTPGLGLAATAAPVAPPAPAAAAKACPTGGDQNGIGASLEVALQSLDVAQPAVDLETVECPSDKSDHANGRGRPGTSSGGSSEVG